jgi:hypothetical protein
LPCTEPASPIPLTQLTGTHREQGIGGLRGHQHSVPNKPNQYWGALTRATEVTTNQCSPCYPCQKIPAQPTLWYFKCSDSGKTVDAKKMKPTWNCIAFLQFTCGCLRAPMRISEKKFIPISAMHPSSSIGTFSHPRSALLQPRLKCCRAHKVEEIRMLKNNK